MLAYTLALRLGEPDPRRILSLPAPWLMMWQVFLSGQSAPYLYRENAGPQDTPESVDAACAAFMRVMK